MIKLININKLYLTTHTIFDGSLKYENMNPTRYMIFAGTYYIIQLKYLYYL